MPREDPVPESWREPLDLSLDLRGWVARVAGGNVRVPIDGMGVAARARRIGQVLLADQHERGVGHPPGVDEPLARRDLLEAAAHVHGACASRGLVRPWDAALDGEVDLERPRAVAVAGQCACDPGRHPIPGDPRRRGWRNVEHDDVGRVELGQRVHAHASLKPRAGAFEQRDHRAADRCRPAFGHGPAVAVRRRAEGHADGCRHRRAEGSQCVCRDSREQRARRSGRPAASQDRGRQGRVEPEPGQGERVLGHVQHRAHEVGGDVIEPLGERAEHRLPAPPVSSQAGRSLLHRAVGRGPGIAVERVGVLNLGPAPRQPVATEVEAAAERRVDGQQMSGRALVVQQPGEGQLARAGSAAQRVGRLEHRDLDAFGSEHQGGSEPIGPAADHDCSGHAANASSATASPASTADVVAGTSAG